MATYRLSRAADRDFENIFEFGLDRFGLEQATNYANGMIAQFDKVARHPGQYQAVDHLRTGYRRSVYRAHAIYLCSRQAMS